MTRRTGASAPRVLLFDWAADGHHEAYLRIAASALDSIADVWIAAPEPAATRLRGACAGVVSLGEARPASRRKGGLGRLRLDRREVQAMRSAVRQARASSVVHLFADSLLPALTVAPRIGAGVSLVLFRPRSHYPSEFGSRLTARERLEGLVYEVALSAWRRRGEARAVLTLDEAAAGRWERGRGAPAGWLPEAPVPRLSHSRQEERSGCVVFGALAPRKGIRELAEALATRPTSMRVVLAGKVHPSYGPEFAGEIAKMRRAGADVVVHDRWLEDSEALDLIARARCALIPYPRHFGSSRFLIEAASVSTPCVASPFGLLGHQVRRWGLGLTADPRNPRELRRAIEDVLGEPPGARADGLAAFAARYTDGAFATALEAVVK